MLKKSQKLKLMLEKTLRFENGAKKCYKRELSNENYFATIGFIWFFSVLFKATRPGIRGASPANLASGGFLPYFYELRVFLSWSERDSSGIFNV